jgi:hypothetical protein
MSRAKQPEIGAERFVREVIRANDVEAEARKHGWDGSDGVMDYCDPEDVADRVAHPTLDAAVKAAQEFLASGAAFWGHVIIDREVFEQPRAGGRLIRGVPPDWERHESYEVTREGEPVEVCHD